MKPEWRDRLKHIESALQRDFYHPLGNIDFEGFVTDKEFRLHEAAEQPLQDMPTGLDWTSPWNYAWMFGSIKLCEAARGERIVLNLNLGGEATLFVNGTPFGTRRAEWVSTPHHYIVDQTITMSGEPGAKYDIAAEVYSAHPMPMQPLGSCATGPVFPEEEAHIMRTDRAIVGENTYGLWNEEAYQLWLDITTLREIMEGNDENSLRVELIEKGLQRLMVELDMEQPLAARREAYCSARKLIAPLMQAHNGSSAPEMFAVGNAHLDASWLWDIGVTRRKTARTFAAQLRLLDEYPEAQFFQSQPAEYELCREFYPEVFAGIIDKVHQGKWIADGAMWVEPDTNMPNGESLVRQFLYGKRYFKEIFGVDSRLCWLPDTFGYSAALPQILNGCDVDYLTTQKIFWTYNGSDRFPHHAFTWQGMDGSRVQCFLHMEYESRVNAESLIKKWSSRVEHDGTGKFLLPFGYGDGGGGPTRDDLEQIRREADLEGAPRIHHADPNEFFEATAQSDAFDNVYNGELYFQCHRGTYTVQAAVKRGNRRAEIQLHDAELWAALAAGSVEYPYETIESMWKLALLNQFHDILPGSSIAKVYQEAAERYSRIEAETGDIIQRSKKALLNGEDGITVFNPLGFERSELVTLPKGWHGARYADGEQLLTDHTGNGLVAVVKVPACGHVSLIKSEQADRFDFVKAYECDGGYVLNNGIIEAHITTDGILDSLIDISTGENRIIHGNIFHMYRDVPRKFDAWDIDSMTEQCEIAFEPNVQTSLIKQNGLGAELSVSMNIGSSTLTQIISLRAGEHMVRFDTCVDWHELHKLLKVEFKTGIHADEARNQIQYGFIKRPTHRSRPYDADRFEVCNHMYTALTDENRGAAVLNDCKYGVSMLDDGIWLSLLRAGAHPDFRTDQGQQRFTYAYDIWTGSWIDSPVVRDAYALNNPLTTATGIAERQSYFTVDVGNIIIDTVKLAEDRSGDIIIRLYESKQAQTHAELSVPMDISSFDICNMLEAPKEACADYNASGKIALDFRPFEVKTLRLRRTTDAHHV